MEFSIRRHLSAAAAIVLTTAGLAGSAQAFEPLAYPASAYDWTGFYLGTQFGWGWADQHIKDDVALDATVALNGGFFGPVFGVQKQWNNFVVGAEVEVNWSDIDGQDTVPGAVGRTFGDVEIFGSLGLKLGYAWNRFLVYGTAGVSGAERETLLRNGPMSTADHAASIGWMAGAGVDYALTQNLILGLQYRHYDFGEGDYDEIGFIPKRKGETDQDVIAGKITVKFGGF
jgi:outer membrane immunogenic protein